MCDIERAQWVWDTRLWPERGLNFDYDDYTLKFAGEINLAKPNEMDPSFSDGKLNTPIWPIYEKNKPW